MTKIRIDNQPGLARWLCARTGGEYVPNAGMYIGLERGGQIVAVTGFESYNGASIAAHIAVDGSHSLTHDYLRFCFQYAFIQLGVNQVLGFVSSANKRALKFDKHLGFREMCVIPEGCPDGDLVILTMHRNDCKFLTSGNPDVNRKQSQR